MKGVFVPLNQRAATIYRAEPSILNVKDCATSLKIALGTPHKGRQAGWVRVGSRNPCQSSCIPSSHFPRKLHRSVVVPTASEESVEPGSDGVPGGFWRHLPDCRDPA